MTTTPDYYDGIIATSSPGITEPDDRCTTCDCRYCGETCHAAEGTSYVVGIGYRRHDIAQRWKSAGRTVRPGDEGWIPVDKRTVMTAAEIERRLFDLTTAQRVAIELGVPADIADMFEAAIVDHSDMLNHVYSTGR